MKAASLLTLMLLSFLAYPQCVAEHPSSVCLNESAEFRSADISTAFSYHWQFPDGASTLRNVSIYFKDTGWMDVTFTVSDGGGVLCDSSFRVYVKDAAEIDIVLASNESQCFGEEFVLLDLTKAKTPNSILTQSYTFSDGTRRDSIQPVFPISLSYYGYPFQHFVDVKVVSVHESGCVSTRSFPDFFEVLAPARPEFQFEVEPNPGCDSDSISVIMNCNPPISKMSSFCIDWGDNRIYCGDSNQNQEIWTGKGPDHALRMNFPKRQAYEIQFTAVTAEGCVDTFLYKIPLKEQIHGMIKSDSNENCLPDSLEEALRLFIKSNDTWSVNNIDGSYYLDLEAGQTHTISPHFNKQWANILKEVCPPYYTYKVDSGSACFEDGFDFAVKVHRVPVMSMQLDNFNGRACREGRITLRYSNHGLADQDSLQIIMEIPVSLSLTESSHGYKRLDSTHYLFDIGMVEMQTFGTIKLKSLLSCSAALNTELCVKASLFPINPRLHQLDSNYVNWDGAQLAITKTYTSDSQRIFVIHNRAEDASGDMEESSIYRIFDDSREIWSNSFKLDHGDSLVIKIRAPFVSDLSLWVSLPPYHPNSGMIMASLRPYEGLDNASVNANDRDLQLHLVESSCSRVRNSFDPNDKKVSPNGLGTSNKLPSNTRLNYVVRFENTGNDTAFRVLIRDELDSDLDISTLEMGVASHPYTWNFLPYKGSYVLLVTFEEIDLLWTSEHPEESKGFVSFSISPKEGLENETRIDNFARIILDENAAIVTNNTRVLLSDEFLKGIPVDVWENGNPVSEITLLKDTFCNYYESIFSSRIYDRPGLYFDSSYLHPDSQVVLLLQWYQNDLQLSYNSGVLSSEEDDASYQWLNCDSAYSAIPGANAQQFYPSGNGNYAVEIRKYNCVDTTDCYSLIGLSLAQIPDASYIRLYPNPGKGHFTLECRNFPEGSLHIYNVFGILVLTVDIVGQRTEIDLRDQASGMYYLQLPAGQCIRILKQ